MFPNHVSTQGSADYCCGLREKSWDKHIQILKDLENYQISLKLSQEFWQYQSNIPAVPNAYLFSDLQACSQESVTLGKKNYFRGSCMKKKKLGKTDKDAQIPGD